MELDFWVKALLEPDLSNTLGPQLSLDIAESYFVKFIYSEKATKFCEISTADLSYVVTVKSTVEISQNFVAFSEYMNFNCSGKKTNKLVP